MIRRNTYKPEVELNYRYEAVANGRHLVPGTEVSIRGERGRFRFISAQDTKAGLTVLNFVGGSSGHEVFRSFYPDRVRRVHRLNRTRANRQE